jgi:hypothetical protein
MSSAEYLLAGRSHVYRERRVCANVTGASGVGKK